MSNEQASNGKLTEEQIEEKIEAARAKDPKKCGPHARFDHVHTILGTAIFRSATNPEWKRHMSLLGAKQVQEGLEQIARDTVVWPDPITFQAWLENAPGIAQAVANPINRLAGMEGSPGKG